MHDSSDIRRRNLNRIRRLMRAGGRHTKQQVAEATGLSVATCNTLLNELERSGEVLGEKEPSRGGAGRSSVAYRINEDHESVLCIYFELIRGVRSITCAALSPSGVVCERRTRAYDELGEREIRDAVDGWLSRYPNATQIVVGTPSIAADGVVRHCDIPELEGAPLVADLEARTGLPVMLANDMHYKAFGYWRGLGGPDEIVTLVNFPSGVLPGTATVYHGRVLEGRDLFAGMVGFLDYGVDREAQLGALRDRDTARPFIVGAATALIAVLNPHRMAFTGDLLERADLAWIRRGCERSIPAEYMPSFSFVGDTDRHYLSGMYGMAMERRDDRPPDDAD